MRWRSLSAALLLGLSGLAFASPLTADADVRNGHCTDDTGVTLVVDFQDLGGETIIACVDDVAPGTTGLQVLQKAGMNPAGTMHDGPGFVCRINDRPSRSETIPISGRPDYRETCRLTPPNSAFWSYWHADNGGSWTFSQYGAGNRAAIVGGYEGWSFSLNRTEDSNPRPRVKPQHALKADEPTPTTAVPEPTTAAPPTRAGSGSATPRHTTAAPSATASRSTQSSRPSQQVTRSEVSEPAGTPSGSSAPSVTPTASATTVASDSTAASPPASESGSGEVTAEATPPASAESSVSPSAAPPVPAESPEAVPMGTLVGAGAVATIAAGGGVVWWRRRAG